MNKKNDYNRTCTWLTQNVDIILTPTVVVDPMIEHIITVISGDMADRVSMLICGHT